MFRPISILLLTFFSIVAFASENDFYIEKTFFEGKKVLKFSENKGGAIVLLEGPELHLMNVNQEFTDISDAFDQHILDDISAIEALNEKYFLVGTNNHSLWLYANGIVSDLGQLNPNLPLRINSIDFDGIDVIVSTSDSIYVSEDLIHYPNSKYKGNTHLNSKLYNGRDIISVEVSRNCHPLGDVELHIEHNYGYSYIPVHENDTINFTSLNDAVAVKARRGNGLYGVYAIYATDNNLYTQYLDGSYDYGCSDFLVSHIENSEVYDLELISGSEIGMERSVMFAAAENGLYILENADNNTYYFDPVGAGVSIIAEIPQARNVNYSRIQNRLFVGTDVGLHVLVNDSLFHELYIGPNELDTLNICQQNEATLFAYLDEQIDISWYHDGEIINGEISRRLKTSETGLYSFRYSVDGVETEIDIAFIQYDSIFEERMVDDYIHLCSYNNYKRVEIDNIDLNHEYQIYSVERGEEDIAITNGEFKVIHSGQYFFIAENCNGYQYISDTVIVEKGDFAPFMDSYDNSYMCEGDSLIIHNAEDATYFKWNVDYEITYGESFHVLNLSNSEDYVRVEARDEHNCVFSNDFRLPEIESAPNINERYLNQQICDSISEINIYVSSGNYFEWAGYENNTLKPVGIGEYPITIKNWVCPDRHDTVHVEYFDPFPFDSLDFILSVKDTLKLPKNSDWYLSSNDFQSKYNLDYIYLTSDIPNTVKSEVNYQTNSSTYCTQSYNLNISFEFPYDSTKMEQIISFDSIPLKTYGDDPFQLSATSSLGLPVSFYSHSSRVSIIENSVWINEGGQVDIVAYHPGNDSVNASLVTQTILIDKLDQVITFDSIASPIDYYPYYIPNAQASSGLEISFKSSDTDVATPYGYFLHLHKADTVIITAYQPGDNRYKPSDEVSRVLIIEKAEQTITFDALTTRTMSEIGQTLSLDAYSSSSLEITYSSTDTSVVKILSANIAQIVGVGESSIIASQQGDDRYNAALPLSRELVVVDENKLITDYSGTISDGSGSENYGNNINSSWLIKPELASTITLSFTEFDLEEDDYLIIYDGDDRTATELGRFTGSTIPESITSSNGSLFIVFLSDQSGSSTGWSIDFESSTLYGVLNGVLFVNQDDSTNHHVLKSSPVYSDGFSTQDRIGFYSSLLYLNSGSYQYVTLSNGQITRQDGSNGSTEDVVAEGSGESIGTLYHLSENGSLIDITTTGVYHIFYDEMTREGMIVPINSVGIIGSAVMENCEMIGWDGPDKDLTLQNTGKSGSFWKITGLQLQDGDYKIRFNHGWAINRLIDGFTSNFDPNNGYMALIHFGGTEEEFDWGGMNFTISDTEEGFYDISFRILADGSYDLDFTKTDDYDCPFHPEELDWGIVGNAVTTVTSWNEDINLKYVGEVSGSHIWRGVFPLQDYGDGYQGNFKFRTKDKWEVLLEPGNCNVQNLTDEVIGVAYSNWQISEGNSGFYYFEISTADDGETWNLTMDQAGWSVVRNGIDYSLFYNDNLQSASITTSLTRAHDFGFRVNGSDDFFLGYHPLDLSLFGDSLSVSDDGTYNIAISTINGGLTYTASIVKQGQVSSEIVWDGDSWSNGTGPTAYDNALISGDLSITSDLSVKDLVINDSYIFTIDPGVTLEVNGDLTVNGDLIIESGASLLTYEPNERIGDVTVKRNTRYADGKYSFVGSPVWKPDETAADLGTWVYDYRETTDYGDDGLLRWEDAFTHQLVPGKGFAQAGKKEIEFVGRPNHGSFEYSGTYTYRNDPNDGWNLVANPYPAAIGYLKFMNDNVNNTGAVYLWDDNGSDQVQGTNADYIVVNASGNTNSSAGNANRFNGNIGSAQGFFIQLTNQNDVSVTFEQDQRIKGNNSDDDFFRIGNAKNRLRINLTSEAGLFKQVLIAWNEDVDDQQINRLYDAPVFNPDKDNSIYSQKLGKALSIQTVTKSVLSIPIGINILEAGTYQLEFDLAEMEQDFYLEDYGVEVDLKNREYQFETESGKFLDRFQVFMRQDLLLVPEEIATFYEYDNVLHFNNLTELSSEVTVYSLLGRKVLSQKVPETREIDLSKLRPGVYVVNHNHLTRKVLID